GLRLRRLVDDLVRTRYRVAQHDRLPHETRLRLDLVALLASTRFRDQVDDRLDCDAACNFPGIVSAHSIGEHPKADVRIGGDGILVVVAHTPDVGQLDVCELPYEAHIFRLTELRLRTGTQCMRRAFAASAWRM